jgi:hypothetical protein
MPRSLRNYAAEQLDAFLAEHEPSLDDHDQVIDRWIRHLVSVGDVPDDILEAMPEVSRHDEPQVSPQEYECGCVAITRVTNRDCRDCRTWRGYGEKPFEMRLAMSCDGSVCALARLRMDQRNEEQVDGEQFDAAR